LAANETLLLDNTVSRNRALADMASKAISGFQAGELEERILALEAFATGHTDDQSAGSKRPSPRQSELLKLAAWRGSIGVRVDRLEAGRMREYADFGGRILDVVLGVLGRHVPDRAVLMAIRNDIARDVRALAQAEAGEPDNDTIVKGVRRNE
jgi:hypothetical protein